VASNPRPGQNLTFDISGEGTLQDQNQNASNPGATSAPATTADNRPGGGLGKPGEDPDPMDQYRWWLLGGFGLVLAAGAVYISRSKSSAANSSGVAVMAAAGPAAPSTSDARRAATLLDALKEELFQLEVEHQQGKISDQEYVSAKSALDQTLARAIKRQN